MDPELEVELKAMRKNLYMYHNKLLELERQTKLSRDAYDISKRRKLEGDARNADDNNGDTEVDAFHSSHLPLQNEYILEMIANYLPSQDLKNCRLVCRLWDKEMARCLSARQLLIVTDEDDSEAKDILLQAKRKDLVTISSLCFFDIKGNSIVYKNLLSVYGWTLSGLKLEECKRSPNELAQVLTKIAPNLESFCFKDRAPVESETISTFFKIQSHIGSKFCMPELKRLQWDEEFGRVKLNEIIAACPNLIELAYKNTPISFPQDFKKLRWDSLKSLRFSPRDELRDEHILSLTCLKLKLRRLTLFGLNPKDKNRMQNLKKLLKSLGSTLEDLELFQHFTLGAVPISSNFESPFPVNLPNLKRLNIDFCILRSMKAINYLPQLRMLECKAKNCTDWQTVMKRVPTVENQTLTNLSLGCIDNKCLLKFTQSYKMCSTLDLYPDKIEDDAMRVIIAGFPQLQQLKISQLTMCSKLPLTDSGLTGLPLKVCQKFRKSNLSLKFDECVAEKKFPAIYDLKDLCRLELGNGKSSISDLSIVYGIANCAKLALLGLPNCNITDASLKAVEPLQLTMLDLAVCANVSTEALNKLRETKKDMILQFGSGPFGRPF